MKKFTMAAIVAALTLPAGATTVDFTYGDGTEPYVFGNKKAEVYDVAIKLTDPALIGTKVTGLEVALNADESYFTDLSGWMSSALTLEKRVNVPDICTKEATVSDGKLIVTFDTPVEVPEEGVYVGYSLTVKSVTDASGNAVTGAQYPLPINVESDKKNAFWVHTSLTLMKWSDLSERYGYASTMTVKLEGDFQPNAANLSTTTMYSELGEPSTQTVNIHNFGSNPINEFDYSYEVNGLTGSGHVDVKRPIPANYGVAYPVEIELPALSESGTFVTTLTIDKVNGEPNAAETPSCEGSLVVMPFIAVNRPLVEEYTGLWCGFCPKGYVAMEEMSEEEPDRFVGMAYHNNDAMAITNSYPSNIPGFPYVVINRSVGVDPEPGNVQTGWADAASQIAVADINATIEWADEEHTAVHITSESRFVESIDDAKYRVAYYIVADGLQRDSWSQTNNYGSREPGTYPGKFWELFLGKGNPVKGLVFNDVVAYINGYAGVDGSIPAEIKAGEKYAHSIDVPVTSIGTSSKTTPFTNYGLMRAICVIMDAETGAVINSAKSDYLDYEGGVATPSMSEAGVTETIWYDLQGRRVNNPVKGIYVKKEVLENGSTRIVKQAL